METPCDSDAFSGGESGQSQPWTKSSPNGRMARRANNAIIARAEALEAASHQKASLYDGAQQSIMQAERTLRSGGWK